MGAYLNMEIPKSCAECDIVCRNYLDRGLDGLLAKTCRTESCLPECPLTLVLSHGRLIDADALKASLIFAETTAKWAVPALRAVLMVIDEMPTIIPSERIDIS